MGANARNVLEAFDELPPAEQHQVAAEILRRSVGSGDMPESALDELAGELFRSYDAEESSGAES